MITLCTGQPTAIAEPEQVILTVPSGSSSIEIALTPHQAIYLHRSVQMAAHEALERCRPEAEIIAMQKRRKRAGRR